MNSMNIKTKVSNVKTDESYLSVTFVKTHKKYTSVMPYCYFDQCCFDEYQIPMEMLQKDSNELIREIGLILRSKGILRDTRNEEEFK